jgi:3-isopropylmalate dehydratase small subunit
MPILIARDIIKKINDKDEISVDFITGEIFNKTQNKKIFAKPFSKSQLDIYTKGGILK